MEKLSNILVIKKVKVWEMTVSDMIFEIAVENIGNIDPEKS